MVKKKRVEHSQGDSTKVHEGVSRNNSKNLLKNYWAISTIVLAVLLVIVLGVSLLGNDSKMSKEAVGQKVIEFAAKQGANATLIGVNESGELYEVILSIQGQEVPVYVTKDGKNLVPTVIPLDTTATETQTPTQTDQPTQTNIPKSDKPTVEAFVMAYCPYGTQIEKGLIPVANLLGDKIDFKIKFVYYAMHPSYGEVEEQLNQYCIQAEQSDKFIAYLTCFLDKGDGEGCIKSTKIDETKLASCVKKTDETYAVTENLKDESKWLSGNYPLFNINKADNEKYSVGGSPTLIINGVESSAGRDSASLLKAVCAAFETAPEECNTELSSASPSTGFGFSTTSGSANSATCG
jgi:hypothetical protein